jgi:uncharacterized protein YndB with AHSA1/START domain
LAEVRLICNLMVAKDPLRIDKHVILRAPRSRVWRALTQSKEFGAWFGVALEGVFEPRAKLRGPITVDGYRHLTMEIEVERMVPESFLSYRWHPYAIDPNVDYSVEATTLVEFELSEELPGTTRLHVVESGFEHIPLERRALALKMNDGGWAQQMENIRRHVTT